MIEKRTAITAEEPQLRKLAYMIDFSRTWALPIILMIVILGSIGFVSSENSDWHSPAVWSDSIYRSIQMFGLNFDLKAPNGKRSNITLDIARYLAAISIFYGAFLVLGKSLAKSIMLRWVKLLSGWSDYVIVLGYGPVGQALARHEALEGAQVVAIDIRVDDVMRQVSTNDNVLLIEGDASTTHTLVYRLGVAKAKRIYISLSTDMQTLDSVRFLTGLIPGDGRSIRAFFNDPELSFRIPAAGEAGLSIARKARTWSVHKLAAQDLCAVEDLGTVAIEANADRVHVVIFGCGSQGMSILQEVLTTCWRVGLAPPAVTVFDREANRIRNRLRSSAASLFSDIQGTEPIPEASRPILHFEYGDLENFDFTKNNSFSDKLQKYSATAFILATGSDTLNLKSALALQDAMQKMTISPAPIYVRIWNTHMGSAANAGFATTSLMRQFGGLDETIAKAKSLRGDPDVSAVELNRIYDAVTSAINRQSPPEKMESWATLSETKKVANRALFRHMPTKIRDIGLQWRASPNPLPKVDLSFVKRFCDAEDALDYTKAERGVPLPPGWVRSGVANLSLSPDAELAYKIKEVAITEHDRWMTERALDGWQPAGYYTTSARDDQRKRHNCMVDWKDLLGKNTTDDLRIRKYDAALLRGIIEQPGAEAYDIFGSERATAYPRSACNLTMSMEKSTGSIYEWEIKEGPMRIPAICTEVFVKIACRKPPRQLHYRLQGAWGNYDKATDGLGAAGAGLLKAFVDWQSTADDNGSLCRVVFVFDHPEELWRSAIIEPLASVLKDNKIHVSTKYTWSSN